MDTIENCSRDGGCPADIGPGYGVVIAPVPLCQNCPLRVEGGEFQIEEDGIVLTPPGYFRIGGRETEVFGPTQPEDKPLKVFTRSGVGPADDE